LISGWKVQYIFRSDAAVMCCNVPYKALGNRGGGDPPCQMSDRNFRPLPSRPPHVGVVHPCILIINDHLVMREGVTRLRMRRGLTNESPTSRFADMRCTNSRSPFSLQNIRSHCLSGLYVLHITML
jgi:hypothetical protein